MLARPLKQRAGSKELRASRTSNIEHRTLNIEHRTLNLRGGEQRAGSKERKDSSSLVGRLENQDLYMPVSEIDPIMDGSTRKNANLHTPPHNILLMVIRLAAREGTNLVELNQQSLAQLYWQAVQNFNRLEVDQETKVHANGYSAYLFRASSRSIQWAGS